MTLPNRSRNADWPEIPFSEWQDTCATLHMWTQIVGKIRLVQTPWTNHSWHLPLYVTARGLTTSPIPYGARSFEIDFDFPQDQLVIRASDGGTEAVLLEARPVAEFYEDVMQALASLDIRINIYTTPSELADGILIGIS